MANETVTDTSPDPLDAGSESGGELGDPMASPDGPDTGDLLRTAALPPAPLA